MLQLLLLLATLDRSAWETISIRLWDLAGAWRRACLLLARMLAASSASTVLHLGTLVDLFLASFMPGMRTPICLVRMPLKGGGRRGREHTHLLNPCRGEPGLGHSHQA